MQPPSAGGSPESFSKLRRPFVVSIREALVLAGAQQSDLRVILAALEQDSVGYQRGADASGPFTELNSAVLGQPPFGLNVKRCNIVKKAIKQSQGTLQPFDKRHSTTGISGGITMEGKLVYIKGNGDNDTSPALIQRSLFQRQDECQSTLFMADGRPAGRLWLKELDDLVETKRAAIRVLQKQGESASQSRPELPGTTPDGLSTSLFPIGCTVEVFPYVVEHQTDRQLTLIEPVSSHVYSNLLVAA